jgi:two-component system, chemotaxis family, chemotaxis protein CheY
VRVLVVDDSRATRAILSRMLRSLSFEPIEAANGREALDALHKGDEFRMALVDWNMPEMDGITFVREVRKEPAHNDMVLMMVTTETGTDEVAAAISAGANDYLMKPFNEDALREKLVGLGVLD